MPWRLATEFRFDAAHRIDDYDGPCGRLHGHGYRVRLELEAARLRPSAHLPKPEMVADFKTLRWAKRDRDQGGLDHQLLNEQPGLAGTTAEQIASYLHAETLRRLRSALPPGDSGDDFKLTVTVWETEESCCAYWE
jgi:6-pyruvoyltetrahydropterin/6-carboxytetrahydropterin synthase